MEAVSQINRESNDSCLSYDQLPSCTIREITDNSASRKTLMKIHEFCKENSAIYLPSHDQKSVNRFFGTPHDFNEIKPVEVNSK